MTSRRLIAEETGGRLDLFVSGRLPELSRSRIQKLIAEGFILVGGRPAKAGLRLRAGQEIEVFLPPPRPANLQPEPLQLDVLYEDEALIVVNKPPGLVVHPAPGHTSGTLVQGLLHHLPDLKGVGGVERPGLVHRLDKETSGLMVVAKDDRSHQGLSLAFRDRRVRKTYLGLLVGRLGFEERLVEAPVGRHPNKRHKMAVVPLERGGREARSVFRLREELRGPLSLVEVDLLTGRTHQIRVQAAHLGRPILGDKVYGSRAGEKSLAQAVRPLAGRVGRQMLHAWRLGFEHPLSGRDLTFEAPLAEDMASLLTALREAP